MASLQKLSVVVLDYYAMKKCGFAEYEGSPHHDQAIKEEWKRNSTLRQFLRELVASVGGDVEFHFPESLVFQRLNGKQRTGGRAIWEEPHQVPSVSKDVLEDILDSVRSST